MAPGSDISDRIYQSIMSVATGRRPHSNRPMSAKSASTQLSFPSSPRHSARSKLPQSSKQGAYTDFDIIKNHSWSASRLRSGAKRADTATPRASRLSHSLTDSRTLLSPVSAPGTAGGPGDNKGKQLNTKELWNLRGSQVERLHQEWAAIENCRAMKRASEMVQHRLDPMYRISGSNIPLLARYHVNDTELQRLQEMSETSRILQLDLKRIKYPQGYTSPRKEKTNSKAHGKPSPHSPGHRKGGGSSGSGNEGEEPAQKAALTSPVSQPALATGNPHPSSPISTPEDTPRFPASEGQEASTEQGEVSQTDDSHQYS
ncbi:uncharacterized protein LOC143300853 isoform X2 [Babylonia areolata]|uniref:uncharacterized protein LOC143300853 isoform X2 n=1 Tax=Babylonia areolata TaxID=304850 RepID=UPI003FD00F2D